MFGAEYFSESAASQTKA